MPKRLMHASNQQGLTSGEARRRLAQYGENSVLQRKKISPLRAFVAKFNNPLLLLLIVASVISIALGQHTDAIIILVMVFLSAVLDFINSQKSQRAVEKLIARVAITVTVVRDRKQIQIPIRLVVPGDIIVLSAGNVVPADCVVEEANDFFINQSALTGESFPVEKTALPSEKIIDTLASDQPSVVLMGSSVITGFATVEVRKTGRATQFGAITESLASAPMETDFERGIRQFSTLILQITFVLVMMVFFINTVMHHGIFASFVFALAIAIGLTPELLPMIISLSLSHGSLLMAKKDVIVKNLSSIQNLGSMTILCTDKTGTLTENSIKLVKYVDGTGDVSEEVLRHAYISSAFHTGVANPLDGAIRHFKKIDIRGFSKIDEIPFDFTRRRESIVAGHHGTGVLITKGAPETIFPICKTYQIHGEGEKKLSRLGIQRVKHEFDQLSNDGFRVLAVAAKPIGTGLHPYSKDEEHDMCLLGFVGFYDPPKKTVREAVQELNHLGIEVKIITGDNELLTEKICREIGMPIKGVVVGKDIEQLSTAALGQLAMKTTVFARITPELKERIIISLKELKHSVGYLGDGINDAPALKAADVGISVNNAVDVARATADIILLKKSLHVLKDGVIEGRKTFQNTLKYIMMGLSSNFGNMFSMTGLSAVLPFFPMLPSQILLNNLMYDVSQFTLPTDAVDAQDIQKPLQWNIQFIRKYMFVFGPISSVFDFLTFGAMYYFFHPSVAMFQAAWFMESLATQTFVIYVIRTRKLPFIESWPGWLLLGSTLLVVGIGWMIPYTSVGRLLGFMPLSFTMLVVISVLIIVYLLTTQIVKMLFFRFVSRNGYGEH